MVLSPHPGVPVFGPEHANPEIEQLSPDAWPFALSLSSDGSAT